MTDLQDISCPHCRKKITAAGAQFCPYCGKDLIPKKRKPRRPNGAGSVTHCGDHRKKPWRARVSAGTRSYTIGYFATSAEAQKAIALFVPPDDPSSRDTITLGEVYDILMHEKETTVTDATLHTYRYAWQPLSPLSGRKIADLRPADYQIVIDHMTDASRSACDKVRSLLSQLCGWAIANGILSSNPAQYIKLPKRKPKSALQRETFTLDEINAIWQDGSEAAHITLAMLYTGMRINELFSLTQDSVHLDEDGYSYIIGGEKTEAGRNRVIVLHERIIPFFRGWTAKGKEYVITNKKGDRMLPLNFRQAYYYPLLSRLGIPHLNPHKTRHTFASMEIAAGADQATLQKLLGHANYSTTANIYHHADLAALKKAIDLLP